MKRMLFHLRKEKKKERKKKERMTKWWARRKKSKKKKSLVLSIGPTIFNLFTKKPLSNFT